MINKNFLDQFDPNTATGKYLENFSALVTVCREQYGDDPDNKPNNHCVWRDIGYMHEMWRWVENDEHLRNRLKERVNK